jgi:hypothetical protein
MLPDNQGNFLPYKSKVRSKVTEPDRRSINIFYFSGGLKDFEIFFQHIAKSYLEPLIVFPESFKLLTQPAVFFAILQKILLLKVLYGILYNFD